MSMKAEIAALKRQKILEAAAKLFAERGYYNTTLDDVAAQLGVTKPFIYGVFKNKSELLAASFLRVVDLCLEAAEAGARVEGRPSDRLRALVERIVHIAADNLAFNAILLREEKSLDPPVLLEVRKREDKFHAALRRILEDGVAAGEFAVPDIRITALAIGGMIGWLYGGRNNIAPSETSVAAAAVSTIVLQMVGAKVITGAPPKSRPVQRTVKRGAARR